jgi:predicted secreted hydrolase
LTEWWYYTGHLRERGKPSGRVWGYQLTFFRSGFVPPKLLPRRASRWGTRDLMFAHLALNDPDGKQFFFDDRIARGSRAQIAGADAANASRAPRIWLGDWSLQFEGEAGQLQKIRALGRHRSGKQDGAGEVFGLDLQHDSQKRPVAHGRNGVSIKGAGEGRSSHYYSMTRLRSRGTITIGAQRFAVEGASWFDHEFGSGQLAPSLAGWDWFSLHLSDGRELMLYSLRRIDGSIEPASSGTLVARDGTSKYLPRAAFEITPLEFWTRRATARATLRSGSCGCRAKISIWKSRPHSPTRNWTRAARRNPILGRAWFPLAALRAANRFRATATLS